MSIGLMLLLKLPADYAILPVHDWCRLQLKQRHVEQFRPPPVLSVSAPYFPPGSAIGSFCYLSSGLVADPPLTLTCMLLLPQVVMEYQGVVVEETYQLHRQAWLQLAEEEGKPVPPQWRLKNTDGMKAEQVSAAGL